MKTCKKCGKKIEDDALVCPYCGCVNRDNKKGRTEPEVTRSSGGSEPPKKRKTWLWILGWLFIFPLPLTILLLRNQKLNKIVKYIIIAVAWLFYLPIALAFIGGGGSKSEKTAERLISSKIWRNWDWSSLRNKPDVSLSVSRNWATRRKRSLRRTCPSSWLTC